MATGDILFELDTEKTIVEVEAWTTGILMDLGVTDGDIVTPRQVVARIVAPGEAGTEVGVLQPASAATSVPAAPIPPVSARAAIPATPAADGPSLSPRARALARELGIDRSTLRAPDRAAWTEQDVRMAAASGGGQG